MMTGDRASVVSRIGAVLDLRDGEVHSGLLPADKVALVAAEARRSAVAFVGDGVNDAAALARADLGVAMGISGSQAAF